MEKNDPGSSTSLESSSLIFADRILQDDSSLSDASRSPAGATKLEAISSNEDTNSIAISDFEYRYSTGFSREILLFSF